MISQKLKRHHKAAPLIAKIRNAELIVFKKSNHDIFADEPKEFTAVVDKFLRT